MYIPCVCYMWFNKTFLIVIVILRILTIWYSCDCGTSYPTYDHHHTDGRLATKPSYCPNGHKVSRNLHQASEEEVEVDIARKAADIERQTIEHQTVHHPDVGKVEHAHTQNWCTENVQKCSIFLFILKFSEYKF